MQTMLARNIFKMVHNFFLCLEDVKTFPVMGLARQLGVCYSLVPVREGSTFIWGSQRFNSFKESWNQSEDLGQDRDCLSKWNFPGPCAWDWVCSRIWLDREIMFFLDTMLTVGNIAHVKEKSNINVLFSLRVTQVTCSTPNFPPLIGGQEEGSMLNGKIYVKGGLNPPWYLTGHE